MIISLRNLPTLPTLLTWEKSFELWEVVCGLNFVLNHQHLARIMKPVWSQIELLNRKWYSLLPPFEACKERKEVNLFSLLQQHQQQYSGAQYAWRTKDII